MLRAGLAVPRLILLQAATQPLGEGTNGTTMTGQRKERKKDQKGT